MNWSHQNGTLQSNGSVTIKTLSGGAYAGTQNPTGAIAKANQTAATQPPTVIIQATGSGYVEAIPKIVNGTTTPPSCSAPYTQAWTSSGNSCPGSSGQVFNVAGTRWSLVNSQPNYGSNVGWVMDTGAYFYQSTFGGQPVQGPSTSCTGTWAATLCTK